MQYFVFGLVLAFIVGAVLLVKYAFFKSPVLRRIKAPIVVYASWAAIWLWLFNGIFFCCYIELMSNSSSSMQIGSVLFVLFVSPFVVVLCLLEMFALAKRFKKKLAKHIMLGYIVYLLTFSLAFRGENLAEIAVSCSISEILVHCINIGYNILFWGYIVIFYVFVGNPKKEVDN